VIQGYQSPADPVAEKELPKGKESHDRSRVREARLAEGQTAEEKKNVNKKRGRKI